ncbi:kinase-like domain-containing protein [Thelephora terrestris]|uniref:Kinase-like domain-containing protein n=1 Tax=Thelephora terrestris TaxID=56493 RepID=A0A9P6HKU8_9AGAM|nr:kinase-like domain-containing protein [Thelephora terrestris]
MANKDFQPLWKGVTRASDETSTVLALAKILVEKEGRDFILHLDRKDAEFCIDVLDRGIAGRDLNTTEKHAFFVTLRRLAGLHGRLPDSMILSDEIEIEDKVLANGGFADVRIGKHKGQYVAVKTLRIAATDDLRKIRKQFCKEVVLWSTLCHPHVLKLKGVYGDMEKGKFITISEWMIHGNIMNFIEGNSVNRLQLLYEAAQGLKYIHGAGLTHGDLKGANILVSSGVPPRACIADFGFMTMVLDPQKPMSCSATLEGGTTTFMPPEILMPSVYGLDNAIPTQKGDIYALGLVVFQVLTGELPFRDIRPTELGFRLATGHRLEKPANAPAIGFSDSLWAFSQLCWGLDRDLRPKVAEVVARLGEAAASWHGPMPPCGKTETEKVASEEVVSSSIPYAAIRGEVPSAISGSPTDSQASSALFSGMDSSSSISNESQDEASLGTIKPAGRRDSEERRPHEPQDEDRHIPDLAQNFQARKRKPFQSFKDKLREFFTFRRRP